MKKHKDKRKHDEEHGKVLSGVAGSLEEAFSEDINEINEDDVIVVDVPKRRSSEKGRKAVAFTAGLLTIIFAVIGLITVITGVAGLVSDIANQTSLKNEFTLYLYPVTATDPPSFEDVSTLPNTTIIKAAVSKIMLTGDMSNYEEDSGVIYIPEFDIETVAKSIFGSGITITHQTVGHVDDLATYITEKKAYEVSSSERVPNYYPVITSLSNVGETYTLSVEYHTPSVSIPGLVREHQASKRMTYVITKSGDKKTITSISLEEVIGQH